MAKINQSLTAEIKIRQRERIANGKFVSKNKEEYLISPGFTTVKVSALRPSYKILGIVI